MRCFSRVDWGIISFVLAPCTPDILFILDRHLEVTGIIPDGPVAKSGKIRIGDTLRRVNGKEVRAEQFFCPGNSSPIEHPTNIPLYAFSIFDALTPPPDGNFAAGGQVSVKRQGAAGRPSRDRSIAERDEARVPLWHRRRQGETLHTSSESQAAPPPQTPPTRSTRNHPARTHSSGQPHGVLK